MRVPGESDALGEMGAQSGGPGRRFLLPPHQHYTGFISEPEDLGETPMLNLSVVEFGQGLFGLHMASLFGLGGNGVALDVLLFSWHQYDLRSSCHDCLFHLGSTSNNSDHGDTARFMFTLVDRY